jgi:ATP-dependent DNA helicase RecG
MRDTSDGFMVAEKDLELRGPGEVLGTRQTGEMQLKIADLQRDAHLLQPVREDGERLLQDHPEQCQALIRRWLANNEKFAQA